IFRSLQNCRRNLPANLGLYNLSGNMHRCCVLNRATRANQHIMTKRLDAPRSVLSHHLTRIGGRLIGVSLILLCSVVLLGQARPEARPDERDQYGRSDKGTSAGGKWMEYQAEDPMTAAKR